MSVTIQTGSLTDFFDSARETARELDRGEKLTRKHSIWVEPEDLARLIKPERLNLVRYLRGKHKVPLSDLIAALHRPAGSMKRDLLLLSKYQLVRVYKEKNPDNGFHNVIEPTFGEQVLEFKVEV
jgi:predicted transcriptional regulator